MDNQNESQKLDFKLFLFGVLILIFCSGFVDPVDNDRQEQNILEYIYSGSRELGSKFQNIMVNPQVQQLLLEMAESPRSEGYILYNTVTLSTVFKIR